jgi:CRP-like cAMP-binding protein
MPAEARSPRPLDLLLRLRRIPLFRALTLESLHALALAARLQPLAPGEPLVRAGEPWSTLCLVLEGEVAGPVGADCAQGLTQRAELLGALALLAGQALPCEVRARGPVQLLRIPGDALFDLLEADSGARLEVLRATAQMLLEAPVDTGGEPPRAAAAPAAQPMDLVQRMLLIWRAFGLENVSVTGLTDLARLATQSVADGTSRLWRVGDVATEGVLVVDGGVALQVSGSVVREVGPGALLGGLDLIAGTPRRYDATPTAGTVLLHLPASQVLGMFEDHFDMAMGVITAIARSALALQCSGRERMSSAPTAPPS